MEKKFQLQVLIKFGIKQNLKKVIKNTYECLR